MQIKKCPYCESDTNDFVPLNQTSAYSGIEITINRQGMLRVRTYRGGDPYESQDIVNLTHCPICGKAFNRQAVKPRLFVDMDGTLAEWKAAASVEELFQEGYFSDLRPQRNVVNAIRNIVASNAAEVFILSAVLPNSEYAVPEKNAWIDKYLPYINKKHRIFCSTTEHKSEAIPGGIHPTDILLDDYTYNLLDWGKYAHGIKLLNGINHTRKTWTGTCVSAENTPQAIETVIRKTISTF